ncbi:hypothetical protein [Nocardia fluminea]|uniref:hypothetical protein n=1 Tax=Nocardia fluminea TaxID=134984 RepID=UPI003787CB23
MRIRLIRLAAQLIQRGDVSGSERCFASRGGGYAWLEDAVIIALTSPAVTGQIRNPACIEKPSPESELQVIFPFPWLSAP